MPRSTCHLLAASSCVRRQDSALRSPLLPFLCRTATIQRRFTRASEHRSDQDSATSRNIISANRIKHTGRETDSNEAYGSTPGRIPPESAILRQPYHIPFDQVSNDPFEYIRRNRLESSDDPSGSPLARESTMTDIERKAFQRLFESLVKEKRTKSGSPVEPRARKYVQNDDITEAESSVFRFKEEELVEDDSEFGILYPDMDGMQVTGEEQDHGQLIKYPRELQGMAAKTHLELSRQKQQHEARQRREDQGKGYDPAFAEQRRELRRIENSLYKAKSDVEIWQIVERDLFSRLRVLDEKHQAVKAMTETAEEGTRRHKRTSRKAKVQGEYVCRAAPPDESKVASPSNEELLDLPINAYSSMFLLAARLLCRRAAYTPLATSLLSTIKSHSLTSFVLGTSTALYNELLAYRWRVFCDLGSMIPLLREMNSSGVSMNEQTLGVLEDITLYRFRAQRGDFGSAAKSVEAMLSREAEANEIGRWKTSVRSQLDEHALERGRRAEAERRMRDEGAFAEDPDDETEAGYRS